MDYLTRWRMLMVADRLAPSPNAYRGVAQSLDASE